MNDDSETTSVAQFQRAPFSLRRHSEKVMPTSNFYKTSSHTKRSWRRLTTPTLTSSSSRSRRLNRRLFANGLATQSHSSDKSWPVRSVNFGSHSETRLRFIPNSSLFQTLSLWAPCSIVNLHIQKAHSPEAVLCSSLFSFWLASII